MGHESVCYKWCCWERSEERPRSSLIQQIRKHKRVKYACYEHVWCLCAWLQCKRVRVDSCHPIFPPPATCLLSSDQCLALSIVKTILSKYDVWSKYEGYIFLVIRLHWLRLHTLNVFGCWGNNTMWSALDRLEELGRELIKNKYCISLFFHAES